ncbi:MAG: cell division protein ZapA [Inquilinus sp.]|nr:cell division protein ZapA [Inquilinus sp.]
MARVDITLAGRNYPIACDDGQEERVRRIAAYIDSKIDSIGNLPTATDTHLLVMASLMLGDELFDAQSRLDGAAATSDADAEADAAIAQSIGRLANRIETIAARLEGA